MPQLVKMEKVCSKCKLSKPLSEFSKDKSKKDGLHYTCRSCNRLKSLKWQKDNKIKYNTRQTLQSMIDYLKESEDSNGHKAASIISIK